MDDLEAIVSNVNEHAATRKKRILVDPDRDLSLMKRRLDSDDPVAVVDEFLKAIKLTVNDGENIVIATSGDDPEVFQSIIKAIDSKNSRDY